MEEVREEQGPNYFSSKAYVRATRDGEFVAMLHPEKRSYPVSRMPTTEAGIDYRFTRDLYVALGDEQADGGWTLRTYIKPWANWIWGGSILMALGGLLSLSDRRFRVAAGARRSRSEGVPAE
jgi:cytochrome c-type biogenesis protein CcmF